MTSTTKTVLLSGLTLVETIAATPPPDDSLICCIACGKQSEFWLSKRTRKSDFLFHRTPDGFRVEQPTCKHGEFITCPDCMFPGCPECGCQEVYT